MSNASSLRNQASRAGFAPEFDDFRRSRIEFSHSASSSLGSGLAEHAGGFFVHRLAGRRGGVSGVGIGSGMLPFIKPASGLDAAGDLQFQPLGVAAAHILDDLGHLCLFDAQASPGSRRRRASADSKVSRIWKFDAGTDQPDRRAAVVGARQHRHQRKFGSSCCSAMRTAASALSTQISTARARPAPAACRMSSRVPSP